MMQSRGYRVIAIVACLLTIAVLAATGCGAKPVSSEAESEVGNQRPAPYSGNGLPDPYVNDKGEIELAYADARGTVTLGAGRGRASSAVLSPDRASLAYIAGDGSDNAAVFIASTDGATIAEREFTPARGFPVNELSFSPCSGYLAVYSSTSSVGQLQVARVADCALIADVTTVSGFVWSPEAPSRLAFARVTDRPLVPLTELGNAADAVILELPSGRYTEIRRGTTNELWRPGEWTGDGRIKLFHSTMLPQKDETEFVAAPTRLPGLDNRVAGSGPLPAGTAIRPEINATGELIISGSDGTPLRKLTDRANGRALDVAVSGDRSVMAYSWLATGADQVRLYRVSLPDLAVREVTPGRLNDSVPGCGPRLLAFAPGSSTLLMAGIEPELTRIYDLDANCAITDIHGWMPVWLPETAAGSEPSVLVGEAASTGTVQVMGEGLSLTVIAARSGERTVLRAASEKESFWPLGFAADGSIIAVRQTSGMSMELMQVSLSR